MKRIAIIASSILLAFTNLTPSFAQLGLPVGGGNSVTGAVCTSGQVYTWGLNQQGSGTPTKGTLGTGNTTAQNIPLPALVTFPNGTFIQQLGAGSGGYFLALDCNGKVWGWGDNGRGQLGNGNTTPQTSPQMVLVQASITPGSVGAALSNTTGKPFRNSTTGQLQGIVKLFAGNATSLAITDDGRLLSWGANDCAGCPNTNKGILGNNTNVDAAFPTFVIDGATGSALMNVFDLSIGDNLAMALVDVNQDGTGLGTVYTWGAGVNGTLGRNPTGTGNNTAETQPSNVALPVRFPTATGGPSGDGYLRNITQIAAGDVAGFAIDVNGYVWAWGNGAYNGITGQGTNVSNSDPRRVLKGATNSSDAYLRAQSVAGGNAFGMAVTLDGKPVSWGNNACSTNATGPAATPNYACGGNLGNGGVGAFSQVPVYIEYGPGQVHSDVTTVARGDYWGYYIRQDNSVWTWGDNSVGQLGIGGYNTQNYAGPFSSIAAGCVSPDPAPKANITPKDTSVCASSGFPITLNSGLKVSATLLSKYKFTWYKVTNPGTTTAATDTSAGNIVKTGIGSAANTYPATTAGRYWVKVQYIGTNVPCNGYPAAYDYMSITTFPVTFAVPGYEITPRRQAYCGDTAYVGVTPNSSASTNPVYSYYTAGSGGTAIGTSTGSGISKILVPNGVTNKGTGNITLWVEQTGNASGIVFKKSQSCEPTFSANWESFTNNTSANPNYQSQFTAYQPITITSLNVTTRNSIYSADGTSISGTLNFGIYGAKLDNNGKLIPDQTVVLGSFSLNVSQAKSIVGQQDYIKEYTVPVNIKVNGTSAGNSFFISPQPVTLTNFVGSGTINLGKADCGQTVPQVDNVTGAIVALTGSSQSFSNHQDPPNNKGGHFYNVNFSTAERFCDRLQVPITLACPCQQPATVVTSSTPAPTAATSTVAKTVTVCAGTAVTLSGTYTKGTNPLTNSIQYVWYKKGTPPVPAGYAAAPTSPVGTKALTGVAADNGVWVLRVEDGTAGSASCYKEDSVKVVVTSIPSSPTVTTPVAYCVGANASPLTAAVTPSSGNSLLWYTGSTSGSGVTMAPTPSTTTAGTPASSSYVSQITSVASGSCEGPRTKIDVNVTALPLPPTSSAPNPVYCQNATPVALEATASGTNTLNWYGTNATGGTASATAPIPSTTATGTFKYYVSQTTASTPSCESQRLEIDVTVNAAPVAPTASNPAAFCVGGTAPAFTATASPTTNTLNWYTQATGGTASSTAPTINNTTPLTQNAWVSQVTNAASGSCEGPRTALTVTLNPVTVITKQPKDTTVCEGIALNLVVSATGTGTLSYQWKQNGTNVGTNSRIFTKPSSVAADAGNYTVDVTGTCGTVTSTPVTVVKINTKPTITLQPAATKTDCAGGSVSASVVATGTPTPTYVWSKGGTAITPAETGSSITLSNLSSASAGSYTVAVSNTCGSVTSTATVVSVSTNVTPSVTLTPSVTQLCGDGTTASKVTLTASPTGGGSAPTYTFKVGTTVIGTANQTTDNVVYPIPANTGTTVQNLSFTVDLKSNSTCITSGATNPVTSSASTLNVDPQVTAALVNITETKATICVDNRSFTIPTLPTSYTPTWSTTNGASVTNGNVTNIGVGTSTLTTYKVQSPLNLCASNQDTVTTLRAGKITDPNGAVIPNNKSYCLSAAAPLLTGVSPLAPGEGGTWSVPPSSTNTVTAGGQTGNLQVGLNRFIYTINSTTAVAPCNVDTAVITLTVIAPPVASITAPIALSSTGTSSGSYVFNTTPLPITATAAATGYTGTWKIVPVSGTGTPSLTPPLTSTSNSVAGMAYDDKATLTWSVTENSNTCTTPAVVTVNLERKNITEAKAKDDTVCFSSSAYSQTPANLPNATASEQGEWLAVGTSPTPAAGTTLSVTFTAPGDYQYTYRIYNPTILDGGGNPIESKNNYTIRVDAPATMANAGSDDVVCSQPYKLNGNLPDATKGETGLWTGSGIVFSNATLNTSNASGMVDGTLYTLIWTIKSKYGKCAVSSDQVKLNKLKNITPAVITSTDTNQCTTASFNLVANGVDPLNNEKGTWTSSDLVIPVGSVNSTTLPLSGLAKGAYKVKWTTSSTSCPNGTSDSVIVNIDSAPTVSAITATDPTCEGDVGSYAASGVSTVFAFSHTYLWSTSSASAGNPTRTFIGLTSGTSSQIKFESSATYLQQVDSATVVLKVSNTCGTGKVSHAVIYKLKPRVVKDTIGNGGTQICSSSIGTAVFGIKNQLNTTGYNWTFDGQPVAATQNFTTPPADSAYVPSSIWSNYNATKTVTVVVTLTNSCGVGASKDTVVTIIKATDLTATLTTSTILGGNSVAGIQRVCLPKQNTTLVGGNTNGLFPSDVTYTYYKNNDITPLGTGASLVINRGTLSDLDQLYVTVATTKGCFTGSGLSGPSNKVVIDGYKVDSMLTVSALKICEGNTITLKVPVSKGNTTYKWMKQGITHTFDSSGNSLTLGAPSQSGRYHVVIGNSVCPTETSKDTTIKIFEQPNFFFATNPLVIVYQDGITVRMPVVVTSPVKDSIIYSRYSPDTWLLHPDSINTLIVPKREDRTIDYTLTIVTGDTSVQCPTSRDIKVINTLPVIIPNAFSPNGDGVNDTWVITGLGKYAAVRVKVYNRWGSLIYMDNDGYKVPWDGNHNGEPMSAGTYYYIVELVGSPDGTDQNSARSLTIVR